MLISPKIHIYRLFIFVDIYFSNVAQLGTGYALPELTDVVVSYDNNRYGWTPVASKSSFLTRAANYNNKLFDCSRGYPWNQALYYGYSCSTFLQKLVNFQLQQSDNLLSPGGYGNFQTQSFSSQQGTWILSEGSTKAFITITFPVELADTFIAGQTVAAPSIQTLNAPPSTGIGLQNTIQAVVKNNGDAGSISFRGTSSLGNAVIPPYSVFFQAGETKTVPITIYGSVAGTDQITITACSYSQIGSSQCDSKSVSETFTATGGGGSPLGGSGTSTNCQALGTGWTWDDNLKTCIYKETDFLSGTPLVAILVVAGLLVGLYLFSKGK